MSQDPVGNVPDPAPQPQDPQMYTTPAVTNAPAAGPAPSTPSPTFPKPGAAVALAAVAAVGGLLLGGIGTAAIGMVAMAGHHNAQARCGQDNLSQFRGNPGNHMFDGPAQRRGCLPSDGERFTGPDGGGRGPDAFGGQDQGQDQLPGRNSEEGPRNWVPIEPGQGAPGPDDAQLREFLQKLQQLQSGSGSAPSAPSAPGATSGGFDQLLKLLAQSGNTPAPGKMATTAPPTAEPDTGS